jgi:hypothetical protein
MEPQVKLLIEKLERLSQARLSEVADFVDFLQQREREETLKQDFAHASSAAFNKVWDNDEDAIYDSL